MRHSMEGDCNIRSASTQLVHVCNRMLVTLEGKGILRMSTEEFMLAARYKPNDPLSAEFIRTFRHQHFHGKYFLEKYEALMSSTKEVDMKILLPKANMLKEAFDEVALYGFRCSHPDVFYLSPWEFVQWCRPHRLKPPSDKYPWSVLTVREHPWNVFWKHTTKHLPQA